VPPFQAREALMRDFNSQEGCSKPILRIKITPEGLSILEWGHKNDISRADTQKLILHFFAFSVILGSNPDLFTKDFHRDFPALPIFE
jgi:hypothetical protein